MEREPASSDTEEVLQEQRARTARRIGRNEAVFRQVNEAIDAGSSGGRTQFFCECAELDCTCKVELTPAEYERVRTSFERFLLVPGHDDVRAERVVEDHGSYVVVEKFGHAAAVADATDPRGGDGG